MILMVIKKSRNLAILILLLLLILGIFVSVYSASTVYQMAQARRQVASLTTVDSPKEFVISFDAQGKQSVTLDVEGWKNLIWKSTIYPHSQLRRILVGGADCGRVGIQGEVRHLLVDSRWNIFWIEITPCSEKPNFFGPFSSTNEIML
jgi:hypothetical protein